MSERGRTIWLTGLSGAGKTTTAHALRDQLLLLGRACLVVDGDDLRSGVSHDLGYSSNDRDENVRRAGEFALLCARQGVDVIVSLISPRTVARRSVRARHHEQQVPFFEVYIATPIAVCEQRDPKALYRRARAGEVHELTGVNDPYEAPEHAELIVSTAELTPAEVAAMILTALARG